jgi:hypothetical protein
MREMLQRRALELRRHGAAWTAPWRPEVHQQRNVAAHQVPFEADGSKR